MEGQEERWERDLRRILLTGKTKNPSYSVGIEIEKYNTKKFNSI